LSSEPPSIILLDENQETIEVVINDVDANGDLTLRRWMPLFNAPLVFFVVLIRFLSLLNVFFS
jgi:hypothetical protein